MTRVVRTTCTRDCPDTCSILAHVAEDGRVTRLQGDPEHPVTRGFLCHRTNRFLERQYDPERLTRPLLRRGDGFEEIGWEAALDLAAERLARVRAESGPAAVFHYRSGGSLGVLKHVTDFFFRRFGPVTEKSGDICSGAGETAQETDFGVAESHDLFDLLHSRVILLWGKNPFVSNVHLLPVLREARKRGTRLVLIDPVAHRTADLCDEVLQPRPGGDFALAMAMIAWCFEHDAVDPTMEAHSEHWAELRALATARSVADWSADADLEAEVVASLAASYAGSGPAAILVGWGMQRRANGAGTVRALDALGAVTGNLGVAGGGVSFYFGRRNAFDFSFLETVGEPPRFLCEPLLAQELPAAQDPPVRLAWITAGNPVAMLPDAEGVRSALEATEFTVVTDSFLTDTARVADLVLPTTTMLEDDDLCGAYGHHWLGSVEPVTAAPDGVRTDLQISQELAVRLGFGEALAGTPTEWKERLLGRVAARGATLDAIRSGFVRNPEVDEVLFADRSFATSSGKVELLHEAPPEIPKPDAAFPLYLMAIAVEEAQASQMPSIRQEGLAVAVVHPEAASGLAEGQRARVESRIGSMEVLVSFDSRQRRDVLLLPKGGWLHRGRCANALIRATATDAGGGAAYYDETVRLLPV